MRNINRREFLGGALGGSAALRAPRGARAADARVEILLGGPTGTVAPEIYGHFIEHLGGVVYDGVNGRPAKLWGLQGPATLHDRRLILTVVNPHHDRPLETEVPARGASVGSCRSRVLTSSDIHAHNTFANPRALAPTDGEVKAGGPTFVYRFAPASATRLQMSLA
jgi:alpha-L-arabinofuranosidase